MTNSSIVEAWHRVKQVLIAFDQFVNCLFGLFDGGAWADETISARAWRCRDRYPFSLYRSVIDRLFWFDQGHCRSSYESEVRRAQSPPGER